MGYKRKKGAGMTPNSVQWVSGRIAFPSIDWNEEDNGKIRTSFSDMLGLRCFLVIISYLVKQLASHHKEGDSTGLTRSDWFQNQVHNSHILLPQPLNFHLNSSQNSAGINEIHGKPSHKILATSHAQFHVVSHFTLAVFLFLFISSFHSGIFESFLYQSLFLPLPKVSRRKRQESHEELEQCILVAVLVLMELAVEHYKVGGWTSHSTVVKTTFFSLAEICFSYYRHRFAHFGSGVALIPTQRQIHYINYLPPNL